MDEWSVLGSALTLFGSEPAGQPRLCNSGGAWMRLSLGAEIRMGDSWGSFGDPRACGRVLLAEEV